MIARSASRETSLSSSASFKIDWEKERLEKPAAKFGIGRVGETRREEGGLMSRDSAKELSGENVFWVQPHPPLKTSQEAAKEFSAVIIDFSSGELAQATGKSKETAKCWKRGRAFPDGMNLKMLEAAFPKIRAWSDWRFGVHDSAHRVGASFADIERFLTADTAEGRAARARVNEIMKETRK